MPRRLLISFFVGFAAILVPAVVFAHVVVTPSQAGVAQEMVFNVSVPNEQQIPITSLKLLIPEGVTDVMPTAKAGWTTTTTANGDAQNSDVTSITWIGSVPVGQRQDFTFSAKAPGKAGELDWKAYQTYADGTVVHWDQKPTGSDDANGNAGPYSVTKVVNDINSSSDSSKKSNNQTGPYILAGAALLLAIAAIVIKRK